MAGILEVLDLARQVRKGTGFELDIEAGGTGNIYGESRGTRQLVTARPGVLQYAPVKAYFYSTNADNVVIAPITAGTDRILGIVLDTPAGDNAQVEMMTSGMCHALVNGAIASGDPLYASSAGRLKSTITSSPPIAYALEANASGDATIWVYVSPHIAVAQLQTQLLTIPFVMDNGGIALTTGLKGAIGPFDFPFTIERWSLLGDQSGSIVVDIYKTTYTAYDPTTHPAVADTITAAAKPTISSAKKAQSSTLTGWTTSVAVDDILAFNIDSIANLQRVTLALKVRRT